MDSALIRAVTSIIIVCIWLAQGCQEAVPDFVQEYKMPFREMTEDSFDVHIVKIPTILHEISSLENSLQPYFKQSSLHSADDWSG